MYEGKSILVIIPARGRSKGLPGKNLKALCGKPLIGWTIETAKKSRYIDRFVVSTEAPRIARIAKKFGAEVPFLRPRKLASGTSKIKDAIIYVLNRLARNDEHYDLVMMLPPTSPLRNRDDVDDAIRTLFRIKGASALISVSESEHQPFWMNTLPYDMSMKSFLDARVKDKNRQELPKYYRLNGAIYAAFTDYFLKEKGFFGKRTFAYLMPKERSVDIDSVLDFYLAEAIIKKRANQKKR